MCILSLNRISNNWYITAIMPFYETLKKTWFVPMQRMLLRVLHVTYVIIIHVKNGNYIALSIILYIYILSQFTVTFIPDNFHWISNIIKDTNRQHLISYTPSIEQFTDWSIASTVVISTYILHYVPKSIVIDLQAYWYKSKLNCVSKHGFSDKQKSTYTIRSNMMLLPIEIIAAVTD